MEQMSPRDCSNRVSSLHEVIESSTIKKRFPIAVVVAKNVAEEPNAIGECAADRLGLGLWQVLESVIVVAETDSSSVFVRPVCIEGQKEEMNFSTAGRVMVNVLPFPSPSENTDIPPPCTSRTRFDTSNKDSEQC